MSAPVQTPTAAELRERLGELTLRDEHRLRGRVTRAGGRVDDRTLAEFAKAAARVERRRGAVPRITYPEQLPVAARRDDLLAAIRDHQVVVVAGETGSGKTTQLPKICLELGRGIRGAIAHTQPRRIAARTVAERIADELRVPLGEAVGYAVRFSDRTREDTLVKLVTDGLLLAEVQSDRLLRRYDTIIVDEAHERSLNIDFLLGVLKQVLPQRPDLKLVITSATIDPQRFAAHFDDAPVVEVSGRTYPVEVRYRPVADEEEPDRDQTEAIGDAVDELLREPPGDVLVFLSGEREIRDTAEALGGRFGDRLEVLPLYARLSTAEQQRVFKPHAGRRVVLATNVAETSLTVPGIRYVVDPGTARISRYSARLKVQRLPIEPVSQASADQRKGRCGRVAEGICIRLYEEEDFLARPRFTDPEIQRTNLASVILQMAAIGLGEVEAFPFLDPPDARQVRDGVALLQELGALEPAGRVLTAVGRRLAQLPVDPRMARMVLEADRLGCADEIVVIAAALSIQDPRERPVEHRAQADQAHARFNDPDAQSDFLALLALWRYLREQQRELSGNGFRKRCKAEFLNYLRVREWQDLVGQLRASAKDVGVTFNQTPAEPREVHVAVLAGLLSHLGLRDARRRGEYLGARGARFAVWPGSTLSRRQPTWVMAAELVETSRLWGRTLARVEPAWVEPLAGHLIKRSYDDPHWERRRASVVATERATLYGLPVVAGRKIAYGSIDPETSRAVFIRKALVEGDWETKHAFFHANRALLEEVAELEHRARRRDLVVDDQTLYDLYDERIPQDVVSGAHFDRWWKSARRREPERLTFTRELLVRPEAVADALDERARPEAWKQGDLVLRLSYRFDPGSAHDGVTVHVPLAALGQLEPTGFEWLVPAFRPELVTALIRSLPKDVRRELVPVPDVAAHVLGRLTPRAAPLTEAVARAVGEVRPVRVEPSAFDLDQLPAHLRMTFRVEDERGGALAEGTDLAALKAQLRPKLRAQLGAATKGIERSGLTTWPGGALPRSVTLPGTGEAVRAFPALVDEGETVGVRVLDTPAAQRAAMARGTRRLLLLAVPSPARDVQRRLSQGRGADPHARAPRQRPRRARRLRRRRRGLPRRARGGPAWDERGFARLRDHVAANLTDTTAQLAGVVVRVLDAERAVRRRLEDTTAEPLQPAARDVEAQLRRLVPAGFVTATGAAHVADLERYLRAAEERLARLPDRVAVDADRMRAIHDLEAEVDAARARGADVAEARRLLEELRVSQFAQGLGVRGPVSAKRIRRLLDA
jgi:ATP-dependent helicase HrpA